MIIFQNYHYFNQPKLIGSSFSWFFFFLIISSLVLCSFLIDSGSMRSFWCYLFLDFLSFLSLSLFPGSSPVLFRLLLEGWSGYGLSTTILLLWLCILSSISWLASSVPRYSDIIRSGLWSYLHTHIISSGINWERGHKLHSLPLGTVP